MSIIYNYFETGHFEALSEDEQLIEFDELKQFIEYADCLCSPNDNRCICGNQAKYYYSFNNNSTLKLCEECRENWMEFLYKTVDKEKEIECQL